MISVEFIWLDCEMVHALSLAMVVGWEFLTSSSFVVRVGIEVSGVVIKKVMQIEFARLAAIELPI